MRWPLKFLCSVSKRLLHLKTCIETTWNDGYKTCLIRFLQSSSELLLLFTVFFFLRTYQLFLQDKKVFTIYPSIGTNFLSYDLSFSRLWFYFFCVLPLFPRLQSTMPEFLLLDPEHQFTHCCLNSLCILNHLQSQNFVPQACITVLLIYFFIA